MWRCCDKLGQYTCSEKKDNKLCKIMTTRIHVVKKDYIV